MQNATPDQIIRAEKLADTILRAAGSSLANYTMQKSRDEIIGAAAKPLAMIDELAKALDAMQRLWNDTLKSNNAGNMCWQDYALMNEAPMLATAALAKAKEF
jgi:hypothetical protein